MNILFHLLPKEKTSYIVEDISLRQAMEKMEYHRYTSVPIISKEGKYVGVLSEGDILWYIKNLKIFDLQEAEKIRISEVPRTKDHKKSSITTEMRELINLSINQNFIPVVDDLDNFIGIVTRKSIITYLVDLKKEGIR